MGTRRRWCCGAAADEDEVAGVTDEVDEVDEVADAALGTGVEGDAVPPPQPPSAIAARAIAKSLGFIEGTVAAALLRSRP